MPRHPSSRRGRAHRDERGQALVEVALVVPLFFATLFGAIDLARVIWANDVVASAAREGARFASVRAGTVGTQPAGTQPVPATKAEIRTKALSYVVGGGVGTTATVCFSAVHVATQQQGCSGDTDETLDGTPAAYQRGNFVTVRVATRVPVVAGALVGFGDITVTGESTVLINN